MRKILVITRDNSKSERIEKLLGEKKEVLAQSVPDAGGNVPADNEVDTLFIDAESLRGANASAGEALETLWEQYPSASIVVMTDDKHTSFAVDAVKAGAFDYLTHPIGKEKLDLMVDKVREADMLQSELDFLRDHLQYDESMEFAGTRSKSMREVLNKIHQVAGTRTTVLLTGETGTGKSLIAKLIHNNSNRQDGPFISVHCGAIPDTLVESELFGHEKGAFTGAVRRKLGKFELAHEGTIFLDEIGTVSQSVQVRLLNVIQERLFQRVGGEADIPVDVRIIAATNEDLGGLSDNGLFRKDLFYRLNVFPIRIPPLRERIEDILKLAESFIKRLNGLLNKDIKGIHPEVLDAFQAYSWPGNVRELENIIERACILETGNILQPSNFPVELFDSLGTVVTSPVKTSLSLKEARQIAIDNFESQYLASVLEQCGGVIKDAALRAGITTRQLNKLMNRHGLRRRQFTFKNRNY
ncbi:sigma-54 dependent transcriptional regulator [Salidesulfovibrio onnuriiensis]|uniref:sigma-54 dependent transcriptional regulator n=1 Tax=Salidesulfovibrio onnuriiensis TaxID=2583823 RepID=UPI0011C9E853|nr:sigma-54 dependent transcriptional regulator [Salidesulfovibrio onnuriiensis]